MLTMNTNEIIIEIEQEDGTVFWTQKSFEFEEILGMEFLG